MSSNSTQSDFSTRVIPTSFGVTTLWVKTMTAITMSGKREHYISMEHFLAN